MALLIHLPIRCLALWIVLLGNRDPLKIPSTPSTLRSDAAGRERAPEFQYHRNATHAGQHKSRQKRSGWRTSFWYDDNTRIWQDKGAGSQTILIAAKSFLVLA